MERNNDNILVPRKAVARFLKDYIVANNAMQMFSYLASRKRLEIHLDTNEICKLLDIKRGQLESLRRKGEIKNFTLGGVRFYSAFDVARAAELIHRPRRFRDLAQIPPA
jgi:DNA polymerase III sliding clamp (beta) subunit (PCNA family)